VNDIPQWNVVELPLMCLINRIVSIDDVECLNRLSFRIIS
jgi:hypothetical protein